MFGQERRRNAEIKLRELQQQLQQVMSVLVLILCISFQSLCSADSIQILGPADDLG